MMTMSVVLAGALRLLQPVDAAEAATVSEKPLAPAVTAQEEEAPPEYPQWSGTLDFGLVEKDGNTNSTNLRLDGKFQRLTEKDRFTNVIWWVYENDSSELTERKYGTRAKYDWFLNGEKFYVFGQGGVGTDFASNIDIRYFVGPGLGFRIIDKEKVTTDLDLGVSYLKEEFDDGGDDNSWNATGAYDLVWNISEKTKFDQDLVALMAVDDTEDILLQWVSALTTNLTERTHISLKYIFDYDNTPADGADRDDHQIVASVGWGFGK